MSFSFASARISDYTILNWGDRWLSPQLVAPPLPAAREFPSCITEFRGGTIVWFEDLAHFHVELSERRVTIFDVADGVTDETLVHLLNDHLAPRIIAHQAGMVLHASASHIERSLCAFIGATGSGKSTLVAAMLQNGGTLLGDDALLITDRGGVLHGEAVYRSLRLLPETASHILGSNFSSSPMAHYSRKRNMDLAGRSANPLLSVPLRAIFELGDALDARIAKFHRLATGAACMKLIEHSFALDRNDREAAAARMRDAARIAKQVPVIRIDYRRDLAAIGDVVAAIGEHVSSLVGENTEEPEERRRISQEAAS